MADTLLAAVRWCIESGAPGLLVFSALYIGVTVVALPASVMCVAAGWAWGVFWGTVLIQAASVPAFWIPFALARRAGRKRVAAAAKHGQKLAALDEALKTHGFLLIVLLRLSPLAPYNVLNYLLGLTAASTRTYLVASIIGSTPQTILFVYLGTLVPRPGELGQVGLLDHPWAFAASLAAVVLSAVALTLFARSALRRVSSRPLRGED